MALTPPWGGGSRIWGDESVSGCEAYAGPEFGSTIHDLMTRLLGHCICDPTRQVELFRVAHPIDERESA